MRSTMRPACDFANCRSRRNVFCGDCAATMSRIAGRAAGADSARLRPSIAGEIRSRAGAAIVAGAAALCAAAIGIGAAVLPWRAIAPIARPDASVYSAATIARGRQLAALGDCAVCHTATNGVAQCRRPAAARRRSAPSTAPTSRPMSRPASAPGPIPPSSARCARASIATAGISIRRFPITHFAKTTDADLQALYAYPDGAGAGARRRRPKPRWRFRSTCARCWPDGMRCFTSPRHSRPTRPNPRPGIAAPIWSKASAIAAPAIRRATRSARKRPTPIWPAASPKAGRRRR